MRRPLVIFAIIIIILAIISQRDKTNPFSNFFKSAKPSILNQEKQTVVYEESVITKVVEEALPSVVTIGINITTRGDDSLQYDPFDPFQPFRRVPGEQKKIEQNIGSGFIISNDGLIITNKHVVSETNATYKVLTNDDKEYGVEKIYRDPLNDLAILKINATNLKPLKMGNSSNLKLGQMAIAIGTPLGEFTNTITTGIVSGLGRGITAGSPFEGYVEKLDNVIQTDAAISPGNSGGPLLNSKGEVIGVNTAIATEGQNLGFAIPVNVVKNLIQSFEQRGGSFERPYIGVRYQMVDKKTAIQNKLVEGAWVEEVIEDSPAAKAGIRADDIITKFDGKQVKGDDEQGLSKLILEKKIGDRVPVEIWRDGETSTVTMVLEAYSE